MDRAVLPHLLVVVVELSLGHTKADTLSTRECSRGLSANRPNGISTNGSHALFQRRGKRACSPSLSLPFPPRLSINSEWSANQPDISAPVLLRKGSFLKLAVPGSSKLTDAMHQIS